MKIKYYKCIIKLTIVKKNGDREDFLDRTISCNQNFYQNFVDVLVRNFLGEMNVITKDIVSLSDDGLVTFRMITDNNDLFSIDGLSDEHAKYLCELDGKSNNKYLNTTGNGGIGSTWMFILMISILVIAFILIVLLIG